MDDWEELTPAESLYIWGGLLCFTMLDAALIFLMVLR